MTRYLLVVAIAAVIGLLIYRGIEAVLGPEVMIMVMLAVLAIVGVVMIRNLRTNRKVNEANFDQRDKALGFTPEPGRAVLYVFRNQFIGRAVGVNILIDGREVAQIKSPRFTRIVLQPGRRRIAGHTGTNKQPGPNDGLDLTAEAGAIYVTKCEIEPQMLGVAVKFTPLSMEAAQADLRKITRMVLPDVAEV